jgi:diguanylate cyclase (GGDEF)-like protein
MAKDVDKKSRILWQLSIFLCLELIFVLLLHYLTTLPIVLNIILSLAAAQLLLWIVLKKVFSRVWNGDSGGKVEKQGEGDFDKIHKELMDVTRKMQKQIYDLHSLFEVSINLTSILEPQELIKSSMLSLIGQLQTNQTIVFLPRKREDIVHPLYLKGFASQTWDEFSLSLKDPIIEKFGDTMIALDLLNVEEELLTGPWRQLVDHGITMVAPIIPKKQIKGIIAVGQKMNREQFTQSERELFSLLAHFISVAFSNSILYQQMEQISITDELTGLYNYRYFKEVLENELERAFRKNRSLSLVLFDVDNFKNYNDTLGHLAGDDALKGVAAILKLTARKTDIAVRYGGEEFCIILPEEGIESAYNFAERLRKAVESHAFEREEVQPGGRLTVSLGVASYPKDADSAQKLMEKADEALYIAKDSGRNRTCLVGDQNSIPR